MAATPIRTHSRKSFIVGWIAIVATGAAGFALVMLPMNHSHENPRIAQAAQNLQTAIPRS